MEHSEGVHALIDAHHAHREGGALAAAAAGVVLVRSGALPDAPPGTEAAAEHGHLDRKHSQITQAKIMLRFLVQFSFQRVIRF